MLNTKHLLPGGFDFFSDLFCLVLGLFLFGGFLGFFGCSFGLLLFFHLLLLSWTVFGCHLLE